jgi:hypothetical protein
MPKPVPNEVVETGKSLIKARKSAGIMSEHIDEAISKLHGAIEVMTKEHGAKAMQAGSALAKLRKAQAALGYIMDAHNDLRGVLHECDVEQPTDAQVLSIR